MIRYFLFFLATLTAVGQSTLTIATKPDPDPPLCVMKKGDHYVACPKPKKHKAPVKPAWDMTPPMFTVHCNSHGCGSWNSGYSLFDKSDEGCSGPGMGDLVQPPADDKGWTGLPDPLKTAQDGYDCTMSRTPKTITIICTLKEPK